MEILAVDIGNNSIKLGQFRGAIGPHSQPAKTTRLYTQYLDFVGMATWLPFEPATWFVATVHRPAERALSAWIERYRPRDRYRLLRNDELPIAIHVEQPQRVGTDRLVAAIGANALRHPGRPAVIVDAGSAITVDLVSAEGAFEGGVILPGFGMVAEALVRGTDQLPLVDSTLDKPPPVVGKSTVAAIRSGMFWGNVGAVRELVRRIGEELHATPQVFIAGGDADRLAPYIAELAQVVPHLVLQGIVLAGLNPPSQDRVCSSENHSLGGSS